MKNSCKILSPLRYVIEPTGRFRNEMEKESGKAERMGIHVAPQAKTILFVNEIILIILICFR